MTCSLYASRGYRAHHTLSRPTAINHFFFCRYGSAAPPPPPGVHTPSINDTLRALASAKASGVRVFRFFASIWGPGHAYWATNPGPFWAEFDTVMTAIAHAGLYCIPSIGTNKWARVANRINPALNESLRDEVTNATSMAQSLAKRFVNFFPQHQSLINVPLSIFHS